MKAQNCRTFLLFSGRVRLLSNPFCGGFQGSAEASPFHFRSNLKAL